MVLPLFVDPAFDETHTVGGEKVWYDKQSGSLIYLDFTQYSLMFNNFTIEQILYSTTGTGQFTFDIAKEKFVTSRSSAHFRLWKTCLHRYPSKI